jgi:hypothetical protein
VYAIKDAIRKYGFVTSYCEKKPGMEEVSGFV